MIASGIQLILGLATLFFGRRLYWLFIGLAGFLFGLALGQQLFSAQPEWVRLILALGLGAVLAGLALVIQRPLIAVGGFLGLGVVNVLILTRLGLNPDLIWLFFVVGGAIGAVLVLVLFDWALIMNSALSGAAAVASTSLLTPAIGGWRITILIIALAVMGMLFQSHDLRTTFRGDPDSDRARNRTARLR